jgi:hypothetical protein
MYTPQYRAFAKKVGLTCQDLAPFWAKARGSADMKYPLKTDDPDYWPFVWNCMKSMLPS